MHGTRFSIPSNVQSTWSVIVTSNNTDTVKEIRHSLRCWSVFLSIKTTWLMHQIQRLLRWSDNIFSLHKCIPHGSERLQGVCDTFVYGDAIDSILYVWFSCFTFVFSWALGWFIGLGLCILIYNSCAKSYMLNTI
jgi:hypothetical protein